MPTPIQRFHEAIRSEETRKPYERYLKQFFEWSKLTPEQLVKKNMSGLDSIVFDYIVYVKMKVEKGELSPNSMSVLFSPIQLFFEQNDIILNWKKLKRMFPRKKAPSNQLPYTTSEIQKMLDSTTSLRNKAFIHVLACSGCRVGAIHDLKVYNVRPIEDGAIVTVYEGDIEEHRTCLTPEAYRVLREYFDFRNLKGYPVVSNSPLFTEKSCAEKITYQMSKDLIRVIRDTSGLRKSGSLRKSTQGKSANHAFRKRVETTLVNSGIHSKYVNYIMGHKDGQDRSYFKATDEELWNEYKKAIQNLTIDKSEQLKLKNEQQKEEIQRYEVEAKNEIESMKKQLHTTKLETLRMIGDIIANPTLLKKLKDQLEE